MKATLGHAELEVVEAGALVVKLSFSACLSATDASTLKLCPTVQKPLCKASSEAVLNLRALFTLAAGQPRFIAPQMRGLVVDIAAHIRIHEHG